MTLTQVEARALDSSGSGRRRMGDSRSTGAQRQHPAAPAHQASTRPGGSRAQFYGLGRQDVIIDSAPPDSAQSTLSIQSEPAFGTSCHASTLHNRFDVSVTYAF